MDFALSGRYVAVAGIFIVLVLGAVIKPGEAQQTDKKPPVSLNKQALDQISKEVDLGGRTESELAAVKLKEIGKRDLSQSERETWVRLARDTAIRTADLMWLQELRGVHDSFALDNIYTVLLAYGKLAKADVDGATATLDSLNSVQTELNIREQRRIFALRARIAQIKGENQVERDNIEKMVDHLASWPQSMCQTCHSSFADKTKPTGLPIRNLWFGERFVELMQKQGDAETVRADAATQLKANPTDDRARIRMAFALRALGKASEADAFFKALPWAEFPGRELAHPRMITGFP